MNQPGSGYQPSSGPAATPPPSRPAQRFGWQTGTGLTIDQQERVFQAALRAAEMRAAEGEDDIEVVRVAKAVVAAAKAAREAMTADPPESR